MPQRGDAVFVAEPRNSYPIPIAPAPLLAWAIERARAEFAALSPKQELSLSMRHAHG